MYENRKKIGKVIDRYCGFYIEFSYNENKSKNYCRMKKLDKFVNRLSMCNNY